METIILLISAVALLTTTGYFFKNYLKEAEEKRERKLEELREHRALSEYMSIVGESANDGLAKIRAFKIDALPKIKADASVQIQACLQKHIDTAGIKVGTIMDNEFYKKAAWACLPNSKWKNEFQDSIKGMERAIVDQQVMGKELENITKEVENKVHTALSSILDSIQIDEKKMSAETRATLNRLKDNPDKMIHLLGKDNELNALINLNLTRDAAVGIGLFSSGLVFHFASEVLDIKTIAALSGGVMKDMFGSEILKQTTIAISNWIMQEVGEQVFAEVMEALAAAATGIGVLFTAWKFVKYGMIGHLLSATKSVPVVATKNAQVNRQIINLSCLKAGHHVRNGYVPYRSDPSDKGTEPN